MLSPINDFLTHLLVKKIKRKLIENSEKFNVEFLTTIIPSCPELCTEAPNHCLDLSSIMLPEALLFPAKLSSTLEIFIKAETVTNLGSNWVNFGIIKLLWIWAIATLKCNFRNLYEAQLSICQNIFFPYYESLSAA